MGRDGETRPPTVGVGGCGRAGEAVVISSSQTRTRTWTGRWRDVKAFAVGELAGDAVDTARCTNDVSEAEMPPVRYSRERG